VGGADWRSLKSSTSAAGLWTRSSAEGGDARVEAACQLVQRQSDIMADSRDPASDQMKLWKEERGSQVHPCSPSSLLPELRRKRGRRQLTAPAPGFPAAVSPGAAPSIVGAGAAVLCRWTATFGEQGCGFWGVGSRPAADLSLALNFAPVPAGTEVTA
jgi:hypothetical protein